MSVCSLGDIKVGSGSINAMIGISNRLVHGEKSLSVLCFEYIISGQSSL